MGIEPVLVAYSSQVWAILQNGTPWEGCLPIWYVFLFGSYCVLQARGMVCGFIGMVS